MCGERRAGQTGRNVKKLGRRFLLIGTENNWKRFGQRVEQTMAENEGGGVYSFHGESHQG